MRRRLHVIGQPRPLLRTRGLCQRKHRALFFLHVVVNVRHQERKWAVKLPCLGAPQGGKERLDLLRCLTGVLAQLLPCCLGLLLDGRIEDPLCQLRMGIECEKDQCSEVAFGGEIPCGLIGPNIEKVSHGATSAPRGL